jgi:hypothetical protein
MLATSNSGFATVVLSAGLPGICMESQGDTAACSTDGTQSFLFVDALNSAPERAVIAGCAYVCVPFTKSWTTLRAGVTPPVVTLSLTGQTRS